MRALALLIMCLVPGCINSGCASYAVNNASVTYPEFYHIRCVATATDGTIALFGTYKIIRPDHYPIATTAGWLVGGPSDVVRLIDKSYPRKRDGIIYDTNLIDIKMDKKDNWQWTFYEASECDRAALPEVINDAYILQLSGTTLDVPYIYAGQEYRIHWISAHFILAMYKTREAWAYAVLPFAAVYDAITFPVQLVLTRITL